MAEITASLVKELRDRTQAGMSDCKNALVEAGGDIEKAVEVILKKGIVKAASRAGRVATEGEVRAVVSKGGKAGIIMEVNCQTDFVARGSDFRTFVEKCCELAETVESGGDLLALKYPGTSRTVDEVRNELIAKLGENIVVRRWQKVDAKADGGLVHGYIHMGGKLGVLMAAEAPNQAAASSPEFVSFVENCAMQIAAMSPIVVSKAQVSAAELEKQKEIFQGQLKEENKPEASWPKIIEGKVQKWYTEVTLLGQESVIEPGSTVDALRAKLAREVGGDIKVLGFVRYQLGEGIEKKSDDLAAEVAKMTGA